MKLPDNWPPQSKASYYLIEEKLTRQAQERPALQPLLADAKKELRRRFDAALAHGVVPVVNIYDPRARARNPVTLELPTRSKEKDRSLGGPQ